MSYFIVWGYKTGLMNKKFIGIKPCGNCGKFSEHYLSKSFFRINLFWVLPIFGVPTGKYLRCGNCDGVRKLTRAEWNEIKENARFMPKKKDYLKAYEELKALVIAASPEDLNTTTIYSRLQNKLDFTDDGGHIRELVDVYLRNSQNAATIAAKAAAPTEVEAVPAAITEETSPALVTEEGVTREVAQAAPAQTPAEAQTTSAAYDYSSSAAPTYASGAPAYAAAESAPKKDSKLRLLWLIPAILLLPIALILALAVLTLFGDPTMDAVSMAIAVVLFALLPLGLDILFFVLAFKKKK